MMNNKKRKILMQTKRKKSLDKVKNDNQGNDLSQDQINELVNKDVIKNSLKTIDGKVLVINRKGPDRFKHANTMKKKNQHQLIGSIPFIPLKKHVLWLSLKDQDPKNVLSLSKDLDNFAEYVSLDSHENGARINIQNQLKEAILCKFPQAKLNFFGSFPVGLSTYLSDIDVSILGLLDEDEDKVIEKIESKTPIPIPSKISSHSPRQSLYYVDIQNDDDEDDQISGRSSDEDIEHPDEDDHEDSILWKIDRSTNGQAKYSTDHRHKDAHSDNNDSTEEHSIEGSGSDDENPDESRNNENKINASNTSHVDKERKSIDNFIDLTELNPKPMKKISPIDLTLSNSRHSYSKDDKDIATSTQTSNFNINTNDHRREDVNEDKKISKKRKQLPIDDCYDDDNSQTTSSYDGMDSDEGFDSEDFIAEYNDESNEDDAEGGLVNKSSRTSRQNQNSFHKNNEVIGQDLDIQIINSDNEFDALDRSHFYPKSATENSLNRSNKASLPMVLDKEKMKLDSFRTSKMLNILDKLFKFIRTLGWVSSIELRRKARVPIINIVHKSGIECDISVGVSVQDTSEIVKGLRNLCGDSLHKLSSFLKILLYQSNLDKPFTGGLGSYKLYVMVAKHILSNPELIKDRQNPNLGLLLLSFFEYFGNPRNFNNTTCLKIGDAEVSFEKTSQITSICYLFKKSHQILYKAYSDQLELLGFIDTSNSLSQEKNNKSKVAKPLIIAPDKAKGNENSIGKSQVSNSCLASIIDTPSLSKERMQHSNKCQSYPLFTDDDKDKTVQCILDYFREELDDVVLIRPIDVKDLNPELYIRLRSYKSLDEFIKEYKEVRRYQSMEFNPYKRLKPENVKNYDIFSTIHQRYHESLPTYSSMNSEAKNNSGMFSNKKKASKPSQRSRNSISYSYRGVIGNQIMKSLSKKSRSQKRVSY